MATFTIPLADQYTVGGTQYFKFSTVKGDVRTVRRDCHRNIDLNTVVVLKPLVRHIAKESGAIMPKPLSKMLKHELKTFCAEHLVFEVEAPPPQPVRHLYNITLNLSYRQGDEPEQASWQSDEQYAEHLRLFHEMEEYLKTHPIEAHVKKNDPEEYIECLADSAHTETISATWLDGFRICLTVETTLTPDKLCDDLYAVSLEDGEYECCGDNGWTIKTLTGDWEVGLVDYRSNPIEIDEIIM